eukprot:3919452-Amphidinium_carterae.1
MVFCELATDHYSLWKLGGVRPVASLREYYDGKCIVCFLHMSIVFESLHSGQGQLSDSHTAGVGGALRTD